MRLCKWNHLRNFASIGERLIRPRSSSTAASLIRFESSNPRKKTGEIFLYFHEKCTMYVSLSKAFERALFKHIKFKVYFGLRAGVILPQLFLRPGFHYLRQYTRVCSGRWWYRSLVYLFIIVNTWKKTRRKHVFGVSRMGRCRNNYPWFFT